ncbi:hypothetical protein SDC9_164659 [bioreactor metagenome]|uniref:Uncharacterized protein n=1 Tax=bioreactor metagenome TaxID=1076179 RepID=A0A645FU69_9ZZZZ
MTNHADDFSGRDQRGRNTHDMLVGLSYFENMVLGLAIQSSSDIQKLRFRLQVSLRVQQQLGRSVVDLNPCAIAVPPAILVRIKILDQCPGCGNIILIIIS